MSFVAAGPARAGSQPIETIERRFTVDGVPDIQVRNVDGRTRLTAADGREVSIHAVKEVTRADSDAEAKRAADRVEVRVEQIGNRIEVETRHPNASFSFGGPRVLVHIEIHAPRNANLDVSSVDGPLDVEGFDGEIDLKTVDGDLTVKTCSGRIRSQSVDGTMDLLDIVGSIDAGTVDGDVEIEGRLRSVQAKSTDGNITVSVRSDSVMEEDWSLRSSDGTIRMTLPEGFGVDLDVEVDDGHIESDHPMTMEGKLSRDTVRGRLYGGGKLLRIRTSDGSVVLRKS